MQLRQGIGYETWAQSDKLLQTFNQATAKEPFLAEQSQSAPRQQSTIHDAKRR